MVSVRKKDERAFARAMRGAACLKAGIAGGDSLQVVQNGRVVLSCGVRQMRDSWKKTMGW